MLKVEAEKKAEKQRQEEEKMKERMRQEKIKKEEERKKLEEKRQANIAEKERIAREQEELRKLKEREAARPQPDLDSTYNKPGDATFNKTLDRTNVSYLFFHSIPPCCKRDFDNLNINLLIKP